MICDCCNKYLEFGNRFPYYDSVNCKGCWTELINGELKIIKYLRINELLL